MAKSHEIDDSYTLSLVLDHQKPLISPSKFHWFTMFVQNPSQRAFLEGLGADLASTGRFWCHFRFSGFPKRHPPPPHFREKCLFVSDPLRPETSRSRPWRDQRPNVDLKRSKTKLLSILFWFSTEFGLILSDCWTHLDTPWPQHTQKQIISKQPSNKDSTRHT